VCSSDLVNPVKNIGKSRNLGISSAVYPLIAFIDADCIAPSDWLKTLVNGFIRSKESDASVCAVGGSNIPPAGKGRFYDTLKIMLNSFLGSGGSVQGKVFPNDRPVDHIPTVNVLYEKDAVLAVGCFDETFGNISEDQDLSARLVQKGYKLEYIAGSFVWHKLRKDLLGWAKNMFTYGKGKIWFFKKYPKKIKYFLFLPALLVICFLLSSITYNPLFLAAIDLYIALMLIYSAFECARASKIGLTIDLFVLYLTTHLSYGIGEFYGIFTNRGTHTK
jgi:GT2 family glycosyltransferase